MNILVVGDASNFHVALSKAMRKAGHNMVVASEGCKWMQTPRDIDISRGKGALGALRYGARLLSLLPKFRDWDVVYIHSTNFLNLRPNKIIWFYEYLRRHNRHIIYSDLGTDYYYVKSCLDCHTFLYSDFRIGNTPSPHAVKCPGEELEWTTPEMQHLATTITKSCGLIVPCLYEYYKTYQSIYPHKVKYGGIPIVTDNITPRFIEHEPEKVKFFLGFHNDRMELKGTDRILEALKKVVARHSDKAEMVLVSNVPYKEYEELLGSSHVILDQLYSYTPATNALLGMARGMVAVSGAEPEFYDFIGEKNIRPIINISPLVPDDIENKLEWIIANKRLLPELSRQSVEFVSKHNDADVVAQRHISYINELLQTTK